MLEVGAGRYSSLSPFLSTLCSDVVCSYYDESQRDAVINRCEAISKKFDLQQSIKFEQINIFEHTDEYDVVVMKSVLGGLCRTDTGIDHMDVIRSICEKNLSDNGILVTIDNGESVFERWVSSFGARKNKWRFFKAEEFVDFDFQTISGFLGFFSLKTRFGKPGAAVENTIFHLDTMLHKFTKSNPVVILSTYSKK